MNYTDRALAINNDQNENQCYQTNDLLTDFMNTKKNQSMTKKFLDSTLPIFLGLGSIPPTFSPIQASTLNALKEPSNFWNLATIYSSASSVFTNAALSWLYSTSVLNRLNAPKLCEKIGLKAKKRSLSQTIFFMLGAGFMAFIFCSVAFLGDYQSDSLKWSLISLTLLATFIMKMYAFDTFEKLHQGYLEKPDEEIVATHIHRLVEESRQALDTQTNTALLNNEEITLSNIFFKESMNNARNKKIPTALIFSTAKVGILGVLIAPSMIAYFSGVEIGSEKFLGKESIATAIAILPVLTFYSLAWIQSLEVIKASYQHFSEIYNSNDNDNLINNSKSYSISLHPYKSLALTAGVYLFVIGSFSTTLALTEGAIDHYPVLDVAPLPTILKILGSLVAVIFNAFPAPEVLKTFFNFYVSLSGEASEKKMVEILTALKEIALLISCSTPESVIKKFAEMLPKDQLGLISTNTLTREQKAVLEQLAPPQKINQIEEQPLDAIEENTATELDQVIKIINAVISSSQTNLNSQTSTRNSSYQTSSLQNPYRFFSRFTNLCSPGFISNENNNEADIPLLQSH